MGEYPANLIERIPKSHIRATQREIKVKEKIGKRWKAGIQKVPTHLVGDQKNGHKEKEDTRERLRSFNRRS